MSRRANYTRATVDRVLELRADGISYEKIRQRLGLTTGQVAGLIYRNKHLERDTCSGGSAVSPPSQSSPSIGQPAPPARTTTGKWTHG